MRIVNYLLALLIVVGIFVAFSDARGGEGAIKMNTAAKRSWQAYEKPDTAELRAILEYLQYQVIQKEGTERPFSNTYWDNKKEGIYVDILSGEPLFSSVDKYESGTGWPSFSKPLEPEYIVEKKDRKLFMTRIEVRSKLGDNHLGHVFNDGPPPTGLRYCMNSAALRFVPRQMLADEGYDAYLKIFE